VIKSNNKGPSKSTSWKVLETVMSHLKYGEERPIVWYCTQKEKLNFESFTQNDCYGNQPQPPEVVSYSIDANTSRFFTKQDLTVK